MWNLQTFNVDSWVYLLDNINLGRQTIFIIISSLYHLLLEVVEFL